MNPVSLHEVDSENSSFFDSENFKELDSDDEFTIEDEKSINSEDQFAKRDEAKNEQKKPKKLEKKITSVNHRLKNSIEI